MKRILKWGTIMFSVLIGLALLGGAALYSTGTDPAAGATQGFDKYLSAFCAQCHSTSPDAAPRGQRKQDDAVRTLRTDVLPNARRMGPVLPVSTYGEMNDTELTELSLHLLKPPLAQAQR